MKTNMPKNNTKINKNSSEEVSVMAGWFVSLNNLAKKYDKNPTQENLSLLLGFISSAEFIVNNLVKKQ